MPVLKYRPFCVVSFANGKNIGLLNVYQYSRKIQSAFFLYCFVQFKYRVTLLDFFIVAEKCSEKLYEAQ